MAMFKAFKPAGMEKIARSMGYQGNMQGFQNYLGQDPMRQQQMQTYQQKAMQMAKGGMVRKMQTGGLIGQVSNAAGGYNTQTGQFTPFNQLPQGPAGQFAPGTLAQAQNQMQMSGNITGNLADAYDPRGGGPYNNAPSMSSMMMSPQQQQEARDFVAAGGVPQMMTNVGGQRDGGPQTGGNVAQGTPNITSGDYRGIPFDPNAMRILEASNVPSGQPLSGRQQPLGLIGTVAPASGVPLALTGGQPGGATPVMNDPRGGLQVGGNMAGPGRPGLLPGETGSVFPGGQAPGGETDGPGFDSPETPPAAPQTQPANIGDVTTQRMYTPGLPTGTVTTAAMTPTGPGQEVQQGTGALTGAVAVPTAMAQTATATPQQESQANVMEAATAAPAVAAAMNATQAAQATVDPRAQVTAAQQTATSVGNLSAAQGNATLIDNPVQRNIQAGELITGAADAQTAATFTEQVQAATATPSTQATVQGQLASLTANFDAANPPAWAAGAMRNATAAMAARGLGASSLAGQAIVQATLESALPIAQADAATVAQFESQNLSNRQQRAMLAAQQRATFMGQEFDQAFQSRVQNSARIGDIANMNFTAEQQVQLENSRAANTMNLNNLSNSQAMVMAEASALAQMDASNLNNRQQAAVNNAQTFLQTDMANLSNKQQTELFKAQQRTQSMFTDQAATNAAAQFNATSQNQVDQFFSSLAQQTSQFNATQQNAQSQFNAGQANTVNRFNAEMNNQRDQFNAQNQIVIAQSNAQWRRQIATADTAAVNRANEINAAALLDISNQSYSNLWQYYGDTMEWAWTSAEKQLDRISALAIAELDAKTKSEVAAAEGSSAAGSAIGSLIGSLGTAYIGSKAFGGFCWVAREVYGKQDTRWFVFRVWMRDDAPSWFNKLYLTHGEKYATFISDKPLLKWATKKLMDLVVESKRKKHYVQNV